MAKKLIFFIPHFLWLLAFIGVVAICGAASGGDLTGFIRNLVYPFFMLYLIPLPTSITAVGFMILYVVKNRPGKGLMIAGGIMGALVIVMFSACFVGWNLGVGNRFFDQFCNFAFTSGGLMAFAIWVLWLIDGVKGRKERPRKKLSEYKYVKKEEQ